MVRATFTVALPPPTAEVASGLLPCFDGTGSILVAASMLGATVMPHAIHLHSSLVTHRHGTGHSPGRVRRLLAATRVAVITALVLAGGVNIALNLVLIVLTVTGAG